MNPSIVKKSTCQSFLSFLFVVLILAQGQVMVNAQTTWNGNIDTDWNTAGNWSAGIPDVNDEVTIPNTGHDPIINNITNAVAKSITVQTGAKLTIENGGILGIDGSSAQAILNEGTVENSGQINIGANVQVGKYGIWNLATFDNNTNGQINIDRSDSGIWNESGSFTNEGTITIGANASVGDFGIWNEATFNNNTNGKINIDDTLNRGIANEAGTFTNEGTFTIGANSSVGDYGIRNKATFDNNTNGKINIDGSTESGILNESGTFTNSATITIGANANVVDFGIWNKATFDNSTNGQINIDNPKSSDIYNQSGTFTNSATITIGANANAGNFSIRNQATFNNNTNGLINIDNSLTIGILNRTGGIFTNKATINIGENASVGNNGIRNDEATFDNNTGGKINIDNSTSRGINNNSGSTFTNSATINIGASASVGNNGIYNKATFSNNTGGQINIDRSTSSGIYNPLGSFTNSATINIGANASVGNNGIENLATFDNNTGGKINIDNSTSSGIYNLLAGSFTNSATINIGASASVGSNGIYNKATFSNSATITIGANANAGTFSIRNQATFDNNTCAILTMFDPLFNSLNFNNSGLFTINTTGAHSNTGTFTNDGIIEYPMGNPVTHVTNNEIIIEPLTFDGCDEINPAFGLGTPVDFTIVGVFTDANATMSAGTYNVVTNTFTPTNTLAEGTYNYFVKIEDGIGGCTRILPWQLTTQNCCELIVTCPPPTLATISCNDAIPTAASDEASFEALGAPADIAADWCGSLSISANDVFNPPTNICNGRTMERTYTIADEETSTTCVQTLTINAPAAPQVTCPADPVPIEWPAGFNTTAVGPNTPQDPSIDPGTYGTATATDNCGDPTVTYQDDIFGPVPGDCPNLWTVQRTWTATDACGLTHSCVQTFTFTDTTPPVIATCPPTVNIEGCGLADIAANGHPVYSTLSIAGDFSGEGGVASDNSTIVTYNYQDVAAGSCPTVVTRTWTLTDYCGLTDVCTQVFNIDDTAPPVVDCKDISVSLTANGDLTVAPGDVFDATGSSDNCSAALTLVSVSPNTFSCLNEGANNVTLTAEDDCSNQATCTATVTIEEFITNITISSTPESCQGAVDGTITASADAGGGQVKYSIDGINFQAAGTFNNMSPDTYTVTIKVFGIPAVCEKTETVSVGAGNMPVTCYKDFDDDDYTDGTTQTTCGTCPSGYKKAGDLVNTTDIDCDDSDPNVNVDQTWYQDADDDNYTDGTTQSSCTRPGGYKTAAELVNTTDIDCDDSDAAVNPGATEVCNGIDDDCDGQVDEGLSGLTYNGNVTFTTQAQVDAWSSCYSIINGNVTILGSGINDLGPLSNIVEITGNLSIQSTGLSSMSGLNALAALGGNMTIYFNSSLTTLSGLNALATVGGSFNMYYNFLLSDCCAVQTLLNTGVTGLVIIFFNAVGCNSLPDINATCPNPLISAPNNSGILDQAATLKPGKMMRVYPNPASNEVNVLFSQTNSTATLKVMDLLGRIIMEREIEQGIDRMTIDLKNGKFQRGIYIVSLMENGEMRTKQLIVKQ